MIICDFEVYRLDSPPKYTAISYTWGAPDPVRTICVAGQKVRVHQNCYDALRQVQKCYARSLGLPAIWIDAICIDQDNLTEKSLQVQAMDKIFGKAQKVAVSLGPSTSESNLLDREFRNLLRHAKDLCAARPDRQLEARMVSEGAYSFWISQVLNDWKDSRRQRLNDAYHELANRAYWSRLWIVQELHAARRIEILSGSIIYQCDWLQECQFHRHFGRTAMQNAVPFIANPATKFDAGTSPLISLRSVLDAYATGRCSDPRDRIYG
jgi:hypothetical protein